MFDSPRHDVEPPARPISHPVDPRPLDATEIGEKARWPKRYSERELGLLRTWMYRYGATLDDRWVRAALDKAANPRPVWKAVSPEAHRDISRCRTIARRVQQCLFRGSATRPADYLTPASFTSMRTTYNRVATKRADPLGQQRRSAIQRASAYFTQHPQAFRVLTSGLLAERYEAGNCSEYASLALVELVAEAEAGAEVARVEHVAGEHVFVLYRSNPDNPWIVCDPWVQRDQACLASDYRLFPEDCADPVLHRGDDCRWIRLAVTPEAKSAFAETGAVMRASIAALPEPGPVPDDFDLSPELRRNVLQYVGTDVCAHRDPGTRLTYTPDPFVPPGGPPPPKPPRRPRRTSPRRT